MIGTQDRRAGGQAPPLTADDEQALGRLIQAGLTSDDPAVVAAGRHAEATMAEANLRLALRLAGKAVRRGLDPDEAESAAMFGLFKAARGFDPEIGTRFSTYATETIKDHLKKAVRRAAKARCDGSTSDVPSFDQPVDHRERPADAASIAAEEEARLRASMEQLHRDNPRWATVVCSRFGLDGDEPLTLAAVGRAMGVTPGRIDQIEGKALGRLGELLGRGASVVALKQDVAGESAEAG